MEKFFWGKVIGNNQASAWLDVKNSPLENRVAAYTDIGAGRSKNQDAAGAFYIKDDNHTKIVLALADGLGCYYYAEEGALEAVTQIPRSIGEGKDLLEAFSDFHSTLLSGFPYLEKPAGVFLQNWETFFPRKSGDKGATTVVVAEISENRMVLSHAGDSRGYLIRNGQVLTQTRDHSLEELLATGCTQHENWPVLKRHHPRNVLLNAMGMPDPSYYFEEEGKLKSFATGTPQIQEWVLEAGDTVILASDGCYANLDIESFKKEISKMSLGELTQFLSEKLKSIFSRAETRKEASLKLDNYTFLIYRHSA